MKSPFFDGDFFCTVSCKTYCRVLRFGREQKTTYAKSFRTRTEMIIMLKINAELIRGLLFERRLSLRQFALKAGLNPSTAAKVIKDGSTVTTKTVADIARFFGVDGNSLILEKE